MSTFDHDFERGLRNRRAILGDAWVDQSLAKTNAFNADFQRFITRYAWHEVWGRPGLEPRARRIVVLAITIALGRWEEFELHVRAALVGGTADTRLTLDEIKEVLIQSAIYAGVPAANTAHALTLHILRELGSAFEPALRAFSPHDACHPGTGQAGHTASRPHLYHTVRTPRHGGARHTVVLSHALGLDHMMWDHLANVLAEDCRVICHDHRGHGQSEAPAGPYTMAMLADDAARLLDELQTGPVVWVGLSMGGMVGQELALRRPDLVKAMVLANTTSGYPQAGREMWQQRIDAIEAHGVESVIDAAMQRWFHEAFRQQHPAIVQRWRRRAVSMSAAGYVACCQAIRDLDTTDRLAQIGVPALVLAGELDEATPLAMSETLRDHIPGAQLAVLPQAAHFSVLEQPRAFADRVSDLLNQLV